MFTTLMHERHNTVIANFGGKPGSKFEYKGTRCTLPSPSGSI